MGANQSYTKILFLYGRATAAQNNQNFQRALSFYTQALTLIESNDDTSRDIIQLQYNILIKICDIYITQIQYFLAATFLEQALQTAIKLQRQDKIADCIDRQGEIEISKGNYHGALHYYNKSLDIKLNIHQNECVDVAYSYHNIGYVYSEQGRYNDAIDMYEKSINIKLSTLGDNHPDIAHTYYHVGKIYSSQGKYGQAISLYMKSLKIYFSVSSDHLRIAIVYESIGLANAEQGKYNDAISFYERAITILVDAHLENHSVFTRINDNLASCYKKQNRSDDADGIGQRCKNILRTSQQVSKNNLSSANVVDQLQGIYINFIFLFRSMTLTN